MREDTDVIYLSIHANKSATNSDARGTKYIISPPSHNRSLNPSAQVFHPISQIMYIRTVQTKTVVLNTAITG